MRRQWANSILHITALIHKRKQALLISHIFKSIFGLVTIIALELVLAVVSLPLYLNISKNKEVGESFKIRQAITLSSLLVILAVWLIKLILIIGLPLYFDMRQFFISENQSQPGSQPFVLPEIYAAPVDDDLTPPSIDSIVGRGNGQTKISGRGTPGVTVLVNISAIADESVSPPSAQVYAVEIGRNGNWSLETGLNRFDLLPGGYSAQAMAYDSRQNGKSRVGQASHFRVDQSWSGGLTGKADRYLNYFMTVFLLVSIFSIVLLV